MTKHSGPPTVNLNDDEAWPFRDGVEEITIRVSRYSDDLKTPVAYQAVAKHRDRKLAWGIGVRVGPVAALSAAIADSYRAEKWASGGEAGTTRSPVIEPDVSIEDLLS